MKTEGNELVKLLREAQPILRQYVVEYGPTPESNEADLLARIDAALRTHQDKG